MDISDKIIVMEEQQPEIQKTVEIVGVRFKAGGKVYYFSPGNIQFTEGSGVIVETVRGTEYGFVAIANKHVKEREIYQPLKSVVRAATADDKKHYERNKLLEENAKRVWVEKVKSHGLVMQLIDVEYTFDNLKLIFYFTADGRVDFRELVKDLASVFHTRIELRQIGVRDEAKMIGGIGVCGRPICCKTFLNDFVQVSIKMAKEQNLSLSSSKISGTCGRLMCCLRYENEVYEQEYATFPKIDAIVEAPDGKYAVVESNFLTGKIKASPLGAKNVALKTFLRDEVKVVGYLRKKEVIDDELKKLEDK